jgi:putative FmdB family regulatory protein
VPTYQYACTVCGHRFDAVQSFSDPSLTECPQCAGLLRKVFSSVGIVFKGSGFYRTDSRSGASTVPPGEAAASSTSSSEGSKSTESAQSSSSASSSSSSSAGSGSSTSSSAAAAAS